MYNFWRVVLTGLGYPSRELQFPLNTAKVAPTQLLNVASDLWIIEIVYTPDRFHDGKTVSDLALLSPPLKCSMIVYGASVSEAYVAKQKTMRWWDRKVEYFNEYGGDDTCFVLYYPLSSSSESDGPMFQKYDHLAEGDIPPAAAKRAKYRARYDAGLNLMAAVRRGDILPSTKREALQSIWLIYMDFDTVITDKTFTFERVLQQVATATQDSPTTEEKICAERHLTGCRPQDEEARLRPTRADQFHFLMTTDQDGWAGWLLNSGVMMIQASNGGAFVLQSVLSLYNESKTAADYTDQGVIYDVLTRYFDWDSRLFTQMYSTDREAKFWNDGIDPVELRMIRQLNGSKMDEALPPSVAQAYNDWIRGAPNENEIFAGILPAKVMNACAREVAGASSHSKVNHWDCNSPIAHFMGCGDHDCYVSAYWREILRSCDADKIPFRTNDDGSSPFDVDTFVQEAKS